MFCDLVGSTLLATRLDPEDLLEVIASYQSAVAESVLHFGGFVARFLGDGVLVYFGWPQAGEDDAERAARAGLKVVHAVGRLSAGDQHLRVRVGIASGLVVVGDIDGPEAVREQSVLGEAPNLAARLQALAEPETVVIAHATRMQIGGLFDCEDLGVHAIKGYAEPVRAWRLHGDSGIRNRFDALFASRQSPIVGRDEEIELLLRRWRGVREREGQAVLIAGEPGIGKSRLISALVERLRGDAYTSVRCYCAPHQQDSSLDPVIGYLEHAARFGQTDTTEDKVRKLRALFPQMVPTVDDMALLADLLTLPADGFPVLNLSAQRKKERTFEVIMRQVERLAGERHVLIILEDAHWCDPTTIELFDLMIDRLLSLPVLLVVTFRLEFRTPWAGRSGVSLITLSRLDRRQSAALVGQLAGRDLVQRELIDQIVEGADGVPLFIEELTRAVLEASSSREDKGAGVSAPLAVPGTLQALLMARLDRLPVAREVAQVGAVIGRQFSHRLLSDIAEMPEPALLQGLEQLVASELVFRHGAPPNAVYRFKHALVQDTAYESLLRSRRSALHAKVVQTLLEGIPNAGATSPGLLAHHCAQAGLIEQAALYYRYAGERSAERAALTETRSQLKRGLMLLDARPDSIARRTLEVELKIALGRVLLSTGGPPVAEAGEVFEEAVVLCRGLDRLEPLTRALWGYWFNKAQRQELSLAEKAAQELLSHGHQRNDTSAQIVARCMLGIVHFWQGQFEEARSNLHTARELCQTGEWKRVDLAIVSTSIDVHVIMQLALTLTCQGRLEEAAAQARLAVANALELAHLPSRAIVLAAKCRHDWFARDDTKMRETTMALIALCEEQAFPFYLALGRCHLGWLAAKIGRIEEGLDMLRAGLSGVHSAAGSIWEPYLLGMMAEAQGWAGDADEARRLLDEALELSAVTGGLWFVADLHRRKGEALLMSPNPDHQSAETSFRHAIAIAQHQSARLWELRAATSLARLWTGEGRRVEARGLLAPVHGWFTEGHDTPDLKDAAALLTELDNLRTGALEHPEGLEGRVA